MGDARNLGDLAPIGSLITNLVNASAPTTASGHWVDVSNYDGDLLLVVNLQSVTGGLGSLAIQAQCSAANTGAAAASCVDNRNAGLLTITALGVYCMPISVDAQPNKFIGVACTFGTITAGDFDIVLLGRLRIN